MRNIQASVKTSASLSKLCADAFMHPEKDVEELAALLVDSGARPDESVVYGSEELLPSESCVFLAAGNGGLGLLRILLDAGADFERADADGWTPLMIASMGDDSLPCARLLVENGADPLVKDSDGMDALAYAFAFGAPLCAEYLPSVAGFSSVDDPRYLINSEGERYSLLDIALSGNRPDEASSCSSECVALILRPGCHPSYLLEARLFVELGPHSPFGQRWSDSPDYRFPWTEETNSKTELRSFVRTLLDALELSEASSYGSSRRRRTSI